MSAIVQKAAVSGKVATFGSPTTAGNHIIVVVTWDEDPPGGGQFIEMYTPPSILPPNSNISDDGGNSYNTVDYAQDNCGIWGTPNSSTSTVSCTTVTIDPHWVSPGTDHGPASPAGLRLRIYEIANMPPPGPTPQATTNLEDNSSSALSQNVSDQSGTTQSLAIPAAFWSDFIGAVSFQIAVLGPSVFGPTDYSGGVASVSGPWVMDDPFNDTAVAYLDGLADVDTTVTFNMSSAPAQNGYGICTGSWEGLVVPPAAGCGGLTQVVGNPYVTSRGINGP